MQILLAEDRHAARTEEHVDRVKRGLNQRPKGGLPTRQEQGIKYMTKMLIADQ